MEKGTIIQYSVALAMSVVTVTMGVASGWPTPVIPKLMGNQTNVEINESEVAWMLSMSAPGFMLGSFAAGHTSDAYGRRSTLLASAAPFLFGMVLASAATVAWVLYIMKLLWGFGTGMVATVLTIYLAEIADKDIRGTLSVITRVGFNFGTFLVIAFGTFLPYKELNSLMLVLLPPSYLFACYWIPESPYYYLKVGNTQDAREVLLRLRDRSEVADAELQRIEAEVKKEMRRSGTVAELFKGREHRRALLIASGLKVVQIVNGALVIQQYFGSLMELSNIDMEISTALIIYAAVKFLVGVMSSVLADRLGRRPLLIYSFFANAVCLAAVGSYFLLVVGLNRYTKGVGFISLCGIIFSTVVSTLGFNSIIGIIQAEILPLNIKSIAMTYLNVCGGFLGFIMAKGYQVGKNNFGLAAVFCFFTAASVWGGLFSYLFVPETKGKTLGEIQEILNKDRGGKVINTGAKDIELTEQSTI